MCIDMSARVGRNHTQPYLRTRMRASRDPQGKCEVRTSRKEGAARGCVASMAQIAQNQENNDVIYTQPSSWEHDGATAALLLDLTLGFGYEFTVTVGPL